MENAHINDIVTPVKSLTLQDIEFMNIPKLALIEMEVKYSLRGSDPEANTESVAGYYAGVKKVESKNPFYKIQYHKTLLNGAPDGIPYDILLSNVKEIRIYK